MPRTSRQLRRRQRLATIGLACICVFVLDLVALHATALGHLPSHMSQFANSPFGLFWALALYCLIVGTSLLVWAVRPCLGPGLSKQVGLGMLALAGIGALLLATFPTDAVKPVTWRGNLHDDAAASTFVLVSAAMVVLAPAFRSSQDLARFARVSLVLGVLTSLALAAYLVSTFNGFAVRGLCQRILVGFILAWFATLAIRLHRAKPAPLRSASRSRRPTARARGTQGTRGTRRPTKAVKGHPAS